MKRMITLLMALFAMLCSPSSFGQKYITTAADRNLAEKVMNSLLDASSQVSDVKVSDLMVMAAYVFLANFIDDYLKVVKKQNLGLKEKPKMLLLLFFGLLLAIAQLKFGSTGTYVWIPFADVDLNFGILYVPFIIFVVAAMTNAVNFTDGLDGLASGVTLPVAIVLALSAIGSDFGTAGIFAGAVAGACAGFLVHNHNPAKVFMGDTGSLALGGAITAVAVMTNTTMVLPIIGFVYVAEIGSVVIQIAVCRWTRRRGNEKRVFRKTPLHHHFEESGWGEVKVVLVFSFISVLLCILGLLIMR